jgi:hypothetical protein
MSGPGWRWRRYIRLHSLRDDSNESQHVGRTMRKRRWSDNDKHLWPFTFSNDTYRRYGIVIDSGAREDSQGDCHIRLYLGGWTLICELPPIIPDYVVRHQATTWDAATIARLGRDWYEERFSREYGFCFVDGSLHTYFGPQTHDSRTTKSQVFFLPWRNYRFIRHSLYDLKGEHFHTELESARASWAATSAVRDACPKAKFDFEDYDGQRITATTHIEEREWRRGTGIFAWRPGDRTLALDRVLVRGRTGERFVERRYGRSQHQDASRRTARGCIQALLRTGAPIQVSTLPHSVRWAGERLVGLRHDEGELWSGRQECS